MTTLLFTENKEDRIVGRGNLDLVYGTRNLRLTEILEENLGPDFETVAY